MRNELDIRCTQNLWKNSRWVSIYYRDIYEALVKLCHRPEFRVLLTLLSELGIDGEKVIDISHHNAPYLIVRAPKFNAYAIIKPYLCHYTNMGDVELRVNFDPWPERRRYLPDDCEYISWRFDEVFFIQSEIPYWNGMSPTQSMLKRLERIKECLLSQLRFKVF